VRFDDMLSTVFAQSTDETGAMTAAWSQTIDILAQGRGANDPSQRLEAFAKLRTLRPQVPVERRRAAAAALASRPLPVDVVAFFGSDAPVVAAPLIMTARLSDAEWADVLPRLPLPSRALLRERRDLSATVLAMLSGIGTADIALPSSQGDTATTDRAFPSTPAFVESEQSAPEAPAVGPSQISDLVERIESYRRARPLPVSAVEAEPLSTDARAFRFEAEADGTIHWVDEVPPGAIIGINISMIAQSGEHGVDGHASGAFRKRTPFRDARMLVPGGGPAAGSWLISGTPWFNSEDGRFRGYRCTARRPLRDENLTSPQFSLLGDGLPADSVRQLVHELRTPLNAMRGFAEMISGQLVGPVPMAYRARAEAIIADSRRLLALFDDLDAAARLDRSVIGMPPSAPSDARRLLHGAAANLAPLTDARDVHLRIVSGNAEAVISVDATQVERMYARLLSTMVGMARSGETISAALADDGDYVSLSVDRPASIAGKSEADLFDQSGVPLGDWPDAPALGLGFALRLIGNMARAAGGHLIIGQHQLTLRLPMHLNSASNGSSI
jgi:hypothetical protein